MGSFEHRIPLRGTPRNTSGQNSSLNVTRHPRRGLEGTLILRPFNLGLVTPYSLQLTLPPLHFDFNRRPFNIMAQNQLTVRHLNFQLPGALPPDLLHTFRLESNPTPMSIGNTDTVLTYLEGRSVINGGGDLTMLSDFTITRTAGSNGNESAPAQFGANVLNYRDVLSLQVSVDASGGVSGGFQISVPHTNHFQITGSIQQGAGYLIVQGRF